MATHLANAADEASREIPFWLILGTLVVVQFVAFWMLCSQQVQAAEVRHAAVAQRQTAFADCLNYLSESTPATCARNRTVDVSGPNTLKVSYVR